MAGNMPTGQDLSADRHAVAVELSAVVVTASAEQPRVLTVREPGAAGGVAALPSGPLEPAHRTLENGLRAWVETRTRQTLGYVEQLYTFGDSNRRGAAEGLRWLSIGYLALAREAGGEVGGAGEGAAWADWYRFLPWEDWREGRPPLLDQAEAGLQAWARAGGAAKRPEREARLRLTFGLQGSAWNDQRVLERYELLYEAGLLPEARRDGAAPDVGPVVEGEPMAGDHRRILATGIARLRGKIRYRPVVFELLPPSFTFLRLQRTVEALAGLRLHKPNFRRLVESQGLVEETGEIAAETGGRPARLLRFRREVLLERPAPGVKLPAARRGG